MRPKKTIFLTASIAILLFLFNSSSALASWFPPVSVFTTPDIGQPSINVSSNFVNLKWCGLPELSSPTVVIRQNQSDGGASGTVPIEIISMELRSVSPITIMESKTVQDQGQLWIELSTDAGQTLPIDSWKEKGAKSLTDILNSNWQQVSGHMEISYGWPENSAKLPAEANGLQIIHKADAWSFLPVGDDDGDKKSSSVRLSLTSKPGQKENFGIFLPQALLNKWGLDSKNTAAIVDGNRVAAVLTEKADPAGQMVNFSFTYPVSVISVGKAMPLSLSANKKSIKKGKKVKLFGWISPLKKGAKVKMLRKLKGEASYKEIAESKTNAGGYYKSSDSPSATALYKAVTNKGKKRIASKAKKVTVK